MAYNTNGGVPESIANFRNAMNDLRDSKQPISDVMAKSMLLQKIQDRGYVHIKDALMATNDNVDVCMQRMLDKYNMMASHKPSEENKKTNSAQQGGKGKGKNKKKDNRQTYYTNSMDNPPKKITYEMVKATPYCVDSDKWKAMIKEQQQVIQDKVRKFYNMLTRDSKQDSKLKDSKVKCRLSKTTYIKNAITKDSEAEDDNDEDPDSKTIGLDSIQL